MDITMTKMDQVKFIFLLLNFIIVAIVAVEKSCERVRMFFLNNLLSKNINSNSSPPPASSLSFAWPHFDSTASLKISILIFKIEF